MRVKHWSKTGLGFLSLVTVPIYFRGYNKNTFLPIQAIVQSRDENESRENLIKWLQLKTREAQYVQVAGAVIFASTTSCLSWPALTTSHWSAGALWYACILLAIPSVLLGTQQLSVIPDIDEVRSMTGPKISRMCESFLSSASTPSSGNGPPVSSFVLFVWQAPRMFFTACMASFLGGLASVIVSPVALRPGWNAEMKTAVIFFSVGLFTLVGFITVTFGIHRLVKE